MFRYQLIMKPEDVSLGLSNTYNSVAGVNSLFTARRISAAIGAYCILDCFAGSVCHYEREV